MIQGDWYDAFEEKCREVEALEAEVELLRAASQHRCVRRASGFWNCEYWGCCVDGTCCPCCDVAIDKQTQVEALEENLAFAQQRAADNGLRAEIGEEKIRKLMTKLAGVRAMCQNAMDDYSEGQAVLGKNILAFIEGRTES